MKNPHIPQEEQAFLEQYNAKDYDAPLVTVDVAIFTLHEAVLKVLLIKRAELPEKGKWALPGGFINIATSTGIDNTALEKLIEKTGVNSPYLEQVGTVGNATRDPRGWSVTVVYFALIPYVEIDNSFSPSVEKVSWCSIEEAIKKKLAFDHNELLEKCTLRLRSKVLYTLMPAHLIKSPFTLSDLQKCYEILIGRSIEKKAFRRRLENADVLESTGEMISEGPGRPAELFKLKPGVDGFNFSRQLLSDSPE